MIADGMCSHRFGHADRLDDELRVDARCADARGEQPRPQRPRQVLGEHVGRDVA